MATKPFVRIIKQGQKMADLKITESAVQRPQTTDSSARIVKATVSAWVKEFQQRRQTASSIAFNNFARSAQEVMK